MVRKSQLNAQDKYDAKNTKQFKMKLNIKTDADILAKLDLVDNKQGYIKELIRRDISGKQNAAPTITKSIADGEFKEGEHVTVNIDGRDFKRKVYYSSTLKEPAVTIFNSEYGRSEFNGGN